MSNYNKRHPKIRVHVVKMIHIVKMSKSVAPPPSSTPSESTKSNVNSSTTLLASGGTYTGTFEVSERPQVGVSLQSDVGGTMFFDFSPDGSAVNTFPVNGFAIAAGVHEFHTAVKLARQFRVRFVMDAGVQTYMRLYTYYGTGFLPSNTPLNQSISTDSDAITTRTVLTGATTGGTYRNIGVNNEGFAKVSISDPTCSFGTVLTSQLTPVFQLAFQYAFIDENRVEVLTGLGGALSAPNNLLTLTTDTTPYSYSTLRSKRKLHYRPGFGAKVRFTALYNTGIANSTQQCGPASAGYGYMIGYDGTQFGVMRKNSGLLEIRTLTVTSAATTGADCTITLNSVAYTVPLTNAGGDTSFTAHEIAKHAYTSGGVTSFQTHTSSNVVYFVGYGVGPLAGTYTFAAGTTGAAGTFAQITAGFNTISTTDTWVYQANFNLDTLDGTGNSGMTLDPTKGNVYEISFQWLGFGAITYGIEEPTTGKLIAFHREQYANANIVPSVANPSFPMQFAVSNGYNGATGTTPMTLKAASCAAFIEGPIVRNEPKFAYVATRTGLSGSAEFNIFSLRSKRTINGVASQIEGFLTNLTVSATTTKSVIVRMYLNPTSIGADTTTDYTKWVDVDTYSGIQADSTADTVTGGTLLWAATLAKDGNTSVDLRDRDIALEVNDTITVTVESVSSGTGDVSAVINWIEDQ